MSTGQSVMKLCVWGVKVGMAHRWWIKCVDSRWNSDLSL